MKPRAAADPMSSSDGRVRRGARNRQSIVTALLELIGEGNMQPTVQQVAERAGVGVRSVFRHFTEIEALYRTMDAHIEREVRPLLRLEEERTGSRDERIDGLVRQRSTFFERIAPFKRSGDAVRWRSRFLQESHTAVTRQLRADLLRWLPELGKAAAPILEASDLLTSFDAWNRLRVDQRLGVKAASGVMAATLRALLGGVAPERARSAGAPSTPTSRKRR